MPPHEDGETADSQTYAPACREMSRIPGRKSATAELLAGGSVQTMRRILGAGSGVTGFRRDQGGVGVESQFLLPMLGHLLSSLAACRWIDSSSARLQCFKGQN